MKQSTNLFLIIIGTVIGFILTALFFPLPAPADEGPQIVLVYQGVHPDGKTKIFIPKDKIALGLTPLGDYAPMSPGAYAVCRLEITPVGVRSLDGKRVDSMNEILFRCGQNKYLFTVLVTKR